MITEPESYPEAELPEGASLVDLDDPDGELPFEYDETLPNLVEAFMEHKDGEAALKEIVEDAIHNFETSWEGNRKYREKVKKNQALFAGDLPPKQAQYENSANCHVPIMLENVCRLATRYLSETFGDWNEVAKVVPRSMEEEDFAAIVMKHLNWQLRNKIPDFKRQMTRTTYGYANVGDVTVYVHQDVKRKRPRVEYLTVDDFVVPYAHISTDPNYGDLPYYFKICRYYRHELKGYRKTWVGVQEVIDKTPGWDDDPETPLRDGMAKVQGEDKPSAGDKDDVSNGAPYVLLQYEGWLELPNQEEDRFCQAIIDRHTRRVLSLRIHEKPNWQDQLRHEQQTAELGQYHEALGSFQDAFQQHEQGKAQYQAATSAGLIAPDPDLEMQMMAEAPQPPPGPPWMKDPMDLTEQPAPMQMEPILMFSHAVAIEPQAGVLGIGAGAILADYNRAANTSLSQFTDSATLNNIKSAIVADNVDLERPLNIAPGKINKARGVSGGELKDSIMMLEFGPANPQLLQLVQMSQQSGQQAAGSPDVLSGKSGKSGESFRGQNQRVENAVQQISVMGSALGDLVTNVLRKIAELNAVFLDDEEFFEVTAPEAKYATQLRVTREMYQRGYLIELTSDMRFANDEEKIQEADQILQMFSAFPQLNTDLPLFMQAVARCLVVRKRKDLIPYLGPLQPPPMTPLAINPMMGAPGGPPPPGGPPGGQPASGTAEPPGGEQGPPPDQGHGPPPGPPPPEQGGMMQ